MRLNLLWVLSATILFALSLVYLHNGYQKKNVLFAWWLCAGVCVQLLGAWGLATGRPHWYGIIRVFADFTSYFLTAAVLLLALLRRNCAVNRTLLAGLGAMFVLNLFGRVCGNTLDFAVRIWLRNIAFFGPALFLLVSFANLRTDRLPLWISNTLFHLGSASTTPLGGGAYAASERPSHVLVSASEGAFGAATLAEAQSSI